MYELDEPAGSDWDDLAGLLGSGSVADLFTAEVGPPRGWGPAFFESADFQMVLDRPLTAPVEADPLVPGEPALVEQTRSGPFGECTIEMGAFYGVRESGVLIAHRRGRYRASARWTHSIHRLGSVRRVAAGL